VVGAADRAGGHVWLSIPFAAPPLGELRFRAPRPPARWTQLREARRSRPACVQLAAGKPGSASHEITGDEDCLYLNVYAPQDGGWLAAREDVIVVATQYRLGPFGDFAGRFATPDGWAAARMATCLRGPRGTSARPARASSRGPRPEPRAPRAPREPRYESIASHAIV
jgi:carboxylesterase type B